MSSLDGGDEGSVWTAISTLRIWCDSGSWAGVNLEWVVVSAGTCCADEVRERAMHSTDHNRCDLENDTDHQTHLLQHSGEHSGN